MILRVIAWDAGLRGVGHQSRQPQDTTRASSAAILPLLTPISPALSPPVGEDVGTPISRTPMASPATAPRCADSRPVRFWRSPAKSIAADRQS